MANNTTQDIIQKLYQRNLEPARQKISAFKVHSKKQRDELYLLCSKIQEFATRSSLPGSDEVAAEGYEKILLWNRNDKQATVNLSALLVKWGDLPKARELLEHIRSKYKDDLLISMNLGTVYMKSNKHELALEIFNNCVELAPENPQCFNNIATLLALKGHDDAAIQYFRKTISLDPMHKTAYMALADLLHRYGHTEESYKTAEIAAKIAPSNPQTYYTLGVLFFRDKRYDEAEQIFRIALSVDPDHTQSRQFLSQVLKIKGSFNEAQSLIANISTHRDNDPAAYVAKVELNKSPLSEADEGKLRHLIDSDIFDDSKLCSAHLALARSAELKGNPEEEIRELRLANAYKRKTTPYEHGSIRGLSGLITAKISKEFIEKQTPLSIFNDIKPIFIIGAPRSGSTLIEQIISSHPLVNATGENGNFGTALKQLKYGEWLTNAESKNSPETFKDLASLYMSLLDKTHPQHGMIFTDKTLFNFYHVGILKTCFPNAIFINCKRHPIDNCLGMYKQIFGEDLLNFTDSFESITEFYKAYQDVTAHWQAFLSKDIYNLQYEELVENFDDTTRSIIQHCGLPWDDNCLNFHQNKREVQTASLMQVRQPIYKTAVAKWKRYEPYIQDLIEKLREAGIKV